MRRRRRPRLRLLAARRLRWRRRAAALIVSAAASLKTAVTDYGASFDDATVRVVVRGLGRARRADPPGRASRTSSPRPTRSSRTSCTPRGWWRSRSCSRATELVLAVPVRRRRSRASTTSPSRARRSRWARSRCRSAPTRARCSTGCPAAERSAILANVRSNEPDVGGRGRQGRPGRGRRGLRLRDRRPGGGRRAEGDRPARGPQAAGGVRCRRGQGREASGAGEGVHRRAARRRRARRAATAPASCRRRARDLVHGAARGGARASRWPSSRCRSSRSSSTSGPRELLVGLDDPGADRRAAGCRCRRASPRVAIIVVVGTPAGVVPGDARRSAAREPSSRWSSCRSCCRPRSRASGCWRRSGRSGLLGARAISFTLSTAAVVVALTFVAAPFYLRQAQSAFAALDRVVAGRVADARRL